MKKKIVMVPMDCRPPCKEDAVSLCEIAGYECVLPPDGLYDNFMKEADCESIGKWLLKEAKDADYVLASVEMLAYGGLAVTSRLLVDLETAKKRSSVFEEIRRVNPKAQIYAFLSIERTSTCVFCKEDLTLYNNYIKYSQARYQIEYLHRKGLEKELKEVEDAIGPELVERYLNIRKRNHELIKAMMRYAAGGILDFLVIGQNDTCIYGLHRPEQMELYAYLNELEAYDSMIFVPGTDELMQDIVVRALNHATGRVPRLFAHYSSPAGPGITPTFSDKPLHDMLRSEVGAMGCRLVDTPTEADAILMIYSPGEQKDNNESFKLDGKRSDEPKLIPVELWDFIGTIRYYLQTGRLVGVGDVSVDNACSPDFVKFLIKTLDVTALASFSGWNAAGNAIGTMAAHAAARWHAMQGGRTLEQEKRHIEFLLERFSDEYLYQTIVRAEVYAELDKIPGAFSLNLGEHYKFADDLVREKLKARIGKLYAEHFEGKALQAPFDGLRVGRLAEMKIGLPWMRMFEVRLGFKIDVQKG